MSNITLTWDSDGSIESFSIYRAEQTIDISNLPMPIATGVTEKTYVDSTVTEDKTYFYRVASMKNGQRKLSNETSVKTTNIYVNFIFDLNENYKASKADAVNFINM